MNVYSTHAFDYAHNYNKQIEFIPVEIWETDNQFYVLLHPAGKPNIKIKLKDNRTLSVEVEYTSTRPALESSLFISELPQKSTKNISLPIRVKNIYYHDYRNGVFTVVLNKFFE